MAEKKVLKEVSHMETAFSYENMCEGGRPRVVYHGGIGDFRQLIQRSSEPKDPGGGGQKTGGRRDFGLIRRRA